MTRLPTLTLARGYTQLIQPLRADHARARPRVDLARRHRAARTQFFKDSTRSIVARNAMSRRRIRPEHKSVQDLRARLCLLLRPSHP